MNRRKLIGLLAATSLVLVPASATAAEDLPQEQTVEQDETTDAESTVETTGGHSEAEAVAVDLLDGNVQISSTGASTEGDGSAEATTVGLGGETVIGGSQEGEGENAGNVMDSGSTELGRLAVAPWETTVEEDRSHAETSVAYAEFIDAQTAFVELLNSESEATEDGSRSETTGATVNLGDGSLELVLLHAQTTSKGDGSAYVASVNGEKIVSSEQANGQCEIPADPLAHITCVSASETEGEGGLTGGSAEVLDAALADDNIHADAFEANSQQAPGDAQAGAEPTDDADDQPAPKSDDRQEQAAPADSLPRTGGGLGLGLAGLLAMGLGAGLRRFGS